MAPHGTKPHHDHRDGRWIPWQQRPVGLHVNLKGDVTGLNDIIYIYMGVSENSVPLNPMVNDHYPY